MPLLKWIEDKDLELAVDHLLLTAKLAKNKSEKEFGKNVIDPFAAIFEMTGFEMEYESWIKSEKARQAQKTLQNHIGEFHQIILGSVHGWENMRTGNVMDLISVPNQSIAEIKNKYNTISGGKLADLYQSMDELVMPKASKYKDYTAYYVAIIPKKPIRFNKEFTPSNKSTGSLCPANPKIREIDGASFYSLVTGDDNALENLFDVLPKVIQQCAGGTYKVPDADKLKAFFNRAYS